ncbi:calcium/proton exchanger [Cladophialophora carrionii CBS 160.54]|uniref:Vacuolar calcium ion transporter n=1 Tax=Cladophialophora carrionii CBS 160.54 TaxID=1279043 RepID=V9D3S2_9EURO|nr:calcium/proton exchanger [Cladophialophora carrionii CBS 160.54]ETI20918.1 calcium/proton exchanger [Cladophialophora carrionii CBS 160.54]
MHKYRHQAKVAAWYDDPHDERNLNLPFGNPFSKWKPNSRSNTERRLENGLNGSPLAMTQTDDPDNYRPSSEGRGEELGATRAPRHAATTPAAKSGTRPYEMGDEVDILRTSSPISEEKVVKEEFPGARHGDETGSDTITNGRPSQPEDTGSMRQRAAGDGQKKRGLKSWFALGMNGEEKDDNNGKDKNKFTVWSQIRATLFNSWINVLLIASPVGIAVYYAGVDPVAVFVINFIAIIPLAAMLSYATEEIALRTGEVIGGLLNASFGNAVELIVSIIALAKDQVLIVQTSLIGSMLSNLLLVMGMCFFFGGINRMEQAFNVTVAQTASSLLFLAVSSLIIPTAFEQWARTGNNSSNTATATTENAKPGVAELSRGTAILLLIVYACYLFFQLKSHKEIYNAPSAKNETRPVGAKFKNAVIPDKMRSAKPAGAETPEATVDEPEEPQLSILVALLTLAASTVLVALNAEYLVDSIDAITCGGGISKNFVGLILLPIVGNAAEHATAVTVAIKDKMDLAIGVAVGSSMQIALLVLPLVVILGWIIGKDDMTLFFDGFQIAVLFVAVLLVNYLISDGKSHYLEGILLMILYVIIAVAAWFYPTAPGLSDCPGEG